MNEQESVAQASRRRFRMWVAATSTLGFGVWWIGSILLHTALFGVLTVVAPEQPTELVSPENPAQSAEPEEFTMTISPDRVEEVVEDIRNRKSEEFQAQLQELMDIQKELEEANLAKVQQYNELMKSEAALAPDAVKKATQEALAAQSEALTAQEQAKTVLSKLGEAQTAAPTAPAAEERPSEKPNADTAKAELEKAQAAAGAAQAKVMTAQVKIEQQLEVFGNAAEEVHNINQTNTELQNQASKLQRDANSKAKALAQLQAKEEALRAKALADNARAEAEQKRQAEEDAKIAELQAAQSKGRELTQLLAKQPKTKLIAERAAQAAAEDARKIAEVGPAVSAAIQQAQQSEEQAQQAQAKAKDALARSADQIAKAVAKASEPVPAPVPAQSEASPTMPQNLAELYKQALQTEDTLTGTYKQVRAAELASIRKIPMAQALALTEVAKPVRNTVDTKILTETIRDVQGVQKQEKAINAASDELDSMVSLARRMRELALPETGASVTVGDLKNQAAHSDRMEQLALQSEGERAKDLTGEMMGDGALTGRDAGDQGEGGGDSRLARFDGPPTDTPKELKPIPGRIIGSGVQTTERGRNAAWMFVDSWYLIGPWPNPGRKNLNTKFPPETVVDLSAIYTGGRRDERPIPVRWRFYQAPSIVPGGTRPYQPAENTGQIIPPGLGEYEIYYAYTELWSDVARDLWVAIGSDDQTKIWINDDMIWKSADFQKGWVPNEGLRKVHFRKGINRILCRYENGHMQGCFSFLISLKSTATAPIQKNANR